MNIEQVLKKAWEAVVAAGIPEPVQRVALREAIRLVATGSLGICPPYLPPARLHHLLHPWLPHMMMRPRC
jgi:hypothetical protein